MDNIRGVFCSNKGNSISRKNGIKKLNNLISKKTNCNSYVDYLEDKAIIYVPIDKYDECLYIGKQYAKMYGIDVNWLNVQGEPRPLNYISLIYGFLPNESPTDLSLERNHQYQLSSIELYIYNLESYLINKKVIPIYNKDNNAIELLIEASIEDYELVRQQCEGFNYTYRNNPFSKIMFLEYNGSLNRDDIKIVIDDRQNMPMLSKKSRFLSKNNKI